MRTNIDIDDELLAQAVQCSGIQVKKNVVEAGLRMLVKIKGQESIRLLRGTIQWDGDLDEMRSDKRRPISKGEPRVVKAKGHRKAV
jgi:Arc/MetJ family transcription regulator